MPTYIVVLKSSGGSETVIGNFDAEDDQDSLVKLPQNIPGQYNGLQHAITCQRCEIDALKYYPRMARPQLGFDSYINMPGLGPLFKMEENAQRPLPHDAVAMSASLNQLTILVRNLEDIFRSVEPSLANLQVYGHLIRNTLLLAAMEFENECKGVLRANGYVPGSNNARWTTVDFVKVLAPLRLREYAVDLAFYPAIPRRNPFHNWNAQAPTQSLSWYDAYNAVKHDREHEFHRATLEAAIDAVTACAIMLAAQYRLIWNWKDQVGGFFNFVESPNWLPTQRYVFRRGFGRWNAVSFDFQ